MSTLSYDSRSEGSVPFVIGISAVAAIGGFLFGFDSGVINGTVDALAESFGTKSAGTAFAVASALLGCAVGAACAGNLADRIGRKPTMFVNAILFLISAIATGAATSAKVFIAARVLGGLAIGAVSILAPMYISEIAPPRFRGRLASLQQLAIVLGLFFAFVSNLSIARLAGDASTEFWFGALAWRWMFWMEAAPSILFLFGVFLIPESPRFLVRIGRRDDAMQIFRRIDGATQAESLVKQVEQSLAGEHHPRLRDLIDPRSHHMARVVWIGVWLAAFQQFVGINIIFYYGEILWKAAGATESVALRTNLLTGFVNILSTFLAIGLIDRVGRRPLLLVGSIGMTITLGAMTVIFAMAGERLDGSGPQLSRAAAIAALVSANLYIVSFGVSWGPVVWVLLGEIFPNRLRGAAIAVSGASNWIANFLVTVTFLPLLKHAGLASAYGLYAAAAFLSLIFVWRLVRETKGKTLEEM